MKYLSFVCFFAYGIVFSQDNQVWMHPNRGQWHENIKYKVDLQGGEFLIEQNAFTYLFHDAAERRHHHDKKHSENESISNNESVEGKFRQHAIKTTFLGSNTTHLRLEDNKSSFYRNYFLGNDQSKWKSDVFSFSKVKYPDFYPNIDLILDGKSNELEYSFLVSANANPEVINFQIEGADKVYLDKNGNLIFEHSFGKIIESKPIAWNVDANGIKTMVPVNFKLHKNNLSFEFPNGYNKSQKLIIDPSITFSSYTGSTDDNWGCTATPDNQGNLFAGGTIFGPGYPTTTGAVDLSYSGGDNVGQTTGFDVSLSKFNSSGTVFLYSTYVGGTGNESPNSMVCNDNGELYIMGVTSSANFPILAGAFDSSHNGGSSLTVDNELGFNSTDIYIARISPGGNAFMSSTFVGGSGNDGLNIGFSNSSSDGDLVYNYGDNYRGEIIVDATGNVLVASTSVSANFPTVSASQGFLNGDQDAVLFKMNANLSNMIWSTYYGGSGKETGNSVQVNSQNEVYLAGGTTSTNLAVPNGQTNVYTGGTADGYVTRFNASTSVIISGTYIGTGNYDQSFFVQIDISDFVYVYGQSHGIMPISAGLIGNANALQFIRKFTQNLSSVVWNTKIGGSNEAISPTAFLVSNCAEIYIAGWGGSILGSNISNFQTTPDAFQTFTSDGDAFYIAVFDPDVAALQYATFMGGPSMDHVDGGTSRFDKNGSVYHAVCSACGGNPNGFVSTPGVVSPTNGSSNCNLAAFKFQLNTITAIAATPGVVICIPNPVQFTNNSTGGDTYFWDFGDLTTSTLENPSHVYTAPGDYIVKLVVSDSQGCQSPDSVSVTVTIGSFEAGAIDPPPTICKGDPYQLEATGGLTYVWTPANVLDNANIPNPIATIFQTTTFTVIVADACGSDTLTVTLPVFNDSISVSPDTSLCLGNSTQIEVFGSVSQVWTPNTFIDNNLAPDPTVTPNAPTTYVVTATTQNSCVFQDSVFVDVFFTPPLPNMIDSATICFGASLDISVSGASTYSWSPNQNINTIIGPDVTVSPTGDFTYFCDFTNACGTERDSVYIEVIRPQISAFSDTIICVGESAFLSAIGAVSYSWSPATGLNSVNTPEVISTPQVNTVYTVIGTDAFLCKDTAQVYVQLFPVHQVYAGGNVVTAIGLPVQLHASSGAEGTFVWLPESFLTCSVCQDPIANPNYNFSYQVIFTDTNGCKTVDFVDINYKGILYIPNTFTPDGSRFNEVFRAYGEGIHDFEMLIFDRWGELICTLNSMEEFWDGTYLGKKCQDGTYTWKLTYNDITGEYKTITGHVNLLK